MSRLRLSVCMIVKNEEKFLAECLESIQSVADQVVVVDTGSTDRTLEIAGEFKSEIHHFKWTGDFAAARNESIKYAKGDWILWLDADERLHPDSLPELKTLIRQSENKPTAYIVQIYNLLQDKKNYKISTAHRLFNNRKGIRFDGRIHEQVSYSISKLGGQEKQCTISLEHLGYGLNPEDQDKKNQRNRELLEALVREEPANAYAHFTLAQHYGLTNELDKAIKHYEIAMRDNNFQLPMQGALLNTMAEACHQAGQSERAIELLNTSIKMIPNQAAAFYMHYRIARDKGNLKKAIEWLLQLLDKNMLVKNNGSSLSTEIMLDNRKIYLSLATHYFELNEYQNAQSWFSRLAIDDMSEIPVLEKAAIAYMNSGNIQAAQEVLVRLTQQAPGNDRYKEWYATSLIKNQYFEQAAVIYESILKRHPSNIDVKKRIAALYAKSGNMQKAAKFLSDN